MVVFWGLLGTFLGLGLYQYFLGWINLLATLVPPLVGPLIVDYYIVNKGRYDPKDLGRLHTWNPTAFVSYGLGALVACANAYGILSLPSYFIPSLLGLAVSMVTYAAISLVAATISKPVGYAGIADRPDRSGRTIKN